MSLDLAILEKMVEVAKQSCLSSYSPYSNFPVGAAVLDDENRIFGGCNVENVSYGLSICAERNAIFQAVGAGSRVLEALVVYIPGEFPATPCGACRQVFFEFGPSARVICVCDSNDRREFKLSDLLPDAFGPVANLKN